MVSDYFPILMLFGFVAANAAMMLAVSHFSIRPRPTPEKQQAYESGIPTLNDATDEDQRVLGKLLLVAQRLAHEHGIAESGYRVSMNINNDAGQSVYHIHLHVMGGRKLGRMA